LPRRDWAQVKRDIMLQADLAKYEQNPDLRQRLLATGNAELIEDSPFEPFWGIGPDGAGENQAGRVLMEVREYLQAEDAG
jgi:N-glycosidase YbiA